MKTFKKILIVFVIVASFFLLTNYLDREPKEFENYSNDGFLNESYKYINDFGNEYYYSLLDNNESKLFYQAMYFASINNESDFNCLYEPNLDAFNSAKSAFVNDWPEYFWWADECFYIENQVYNIIRIPYTIYNFYVGDVESLDIENTVLKTNSFVEEVIDSCSAEDQYTFVKKVHDYLIKHVEYDNKLPLSHTAYGSIFSGKGVCDGYARAFQLITKRAGFDSIVVYGDATNNESTDYHAWNLIKLGDNWYHVDTTWDDLIDEDGKQLDVSYEYFLLNDDFISIDHKEDSNYAYPYSNDMSLYFLNMPGYYTDCFDKSEISNFILSELREGKSMLGIKFLHKDDALKAKEWLYDGNGFVAIFNRYRTYYDISYSISCSEYNNYVQIYYENN